MKKRNQTLSFIDADNSWGGYSVAHLLAMHFTEHSSPGAGTDIIELYFSVEIIMVEGKELRPLWQALLEGQATDPDGTMPEYRISRLLQQRYKGDQEENEVEPGRIAPPDAAARAENLHPKNLTEHIIKA